MRRHACPGGGKRADELGLRTVILGLANRPKDVPHGDAGTHILQHAIQHGIIIEVRRRHAITVPAAVTVLELEEESLEVHVESQPEHGLGSGHQFVFAELDGNGPRPLVEILVDGHREIEEEELVAGVYDHDLTVGVRTSLRFELFDVVPFMEGHDVSSLFLELFINHAPRLLLVKGEHENDITQVPGEEKDQIRNSHAALLVMAAMAVEFLRPRRLLEITEFHAAILDKIWESTTKNDTLK